MTTDNCHGVFRLVLYCIISYLACLYSIITCYCFQQYDIYNTSIHSFRHSFISIRFRKNPWILKQNIFPSQFSAGIVSINPFKFFISDSVSFCFSETKFHIDNLPDFSEYLLYCSSFSEVSDGPCLRRWTNLAKYCSIYVVILNSGLQIVQILFLIERLGAYRSYCRSSSLKWTVKN